MLIDGLRQKKLIIGISAIAIVACVIGAMILLTNPVTDASDDKEQISGQVSEETNTLDGNPDGNKLDAIYYKDTCYYGLAMSQTFQKGEEPEGFAYIGKLVYIVDRYQSPIRNLNATIGEVGDDVYHYVDEKGFHYFCIPTVYNESSGMTKYLTISKATANKPDYYTSGEEADAKGGVYYGKNSETEVAARYLEGALYAGTLKMGATELSYTGYRKYETLDYTIDIQDAENTILQTLEYSYDLGEDTPTDYGIFSKDVNQDGCEDILLKLAGHGNIGPVWACFVYDKETKQFVQVEGFEELPGVEITNEIRSYYSSGGGVYYRLERYVIENNKLILEGRLEQEIKGNDLGEYISCQEEHYEDGRIVYQKKNISVDEIDMNFWNQDIGEGLNKN